LCTPLYFYADLYLYDPLYLFDLPFMILYCA
jgi:hypothetical protein